MNPQTDFSFIHRYFVAEKQESILFLLVGLAGVAAGIILFFFVRSHQSFYRGAAIPLFLLGWILAIVGYTVFARSDQQRIDVAYYAGLNTAAFVRNDELPRMEKVMRSFVVYRWVEIGLFLAGIGLYLYFMRDIRHDFWRGFGLALALMALLALGADFFAERRGAAYTRELRQMVA